MPRRNRLVLALAVFATASLLTSSVRSQTAEFIRGDVNNDVSVNLSDAIATLNYLFNSGPLTCEAAADCNANGGVDLADPVYLLGYLFASTTAPPAPFPDCGVDPAPSSLTCDSAPACGLGGPVMGLGTAQYMAFFRGKALFEKDFKRSEGIGPHFNSTSCKACHLTPVTGGSAPNYRNFYLAAVGFPGAQFHIQNPPDIPSMVVPSFYTVGARRVLIPASGSPAVSGLPVVSAQRNAPPMFGTGLFEFVRNVDIAANADPNDAITPDGISGRMNHDFALDPSVQGQGPQGNVGRFGYKCQANFIEPFIRGAANNQMGLTTNPIEGNAGIVQLAAAAQVGSSITQNLTDLDAVPDPEISDADFADIIAFSRFIAPPKPKPFGAAELAGEALFTSIGCAKCHVPTLPLDNTLNGGSITAYTDLLIHDMGPTLADGISMGRPQPDATHPFTTENEFRTQPLWGVSMHAPFMHDGRAGTLDEAILLHGGEAQAIRDAYDQLTQQEKDDMIAFLEAI
ncbi:MAG: di-heme oxidoredictase family protein [Planctomycetota bacterium]